MALQLTRNIQDGVPWVKRSSLDEREVLSTGACTIIMAKGQNVIQESLMLLPVLNNIHCALFVKGFKHVVSMGSAARNEQMHMILDALEER